MKHKRFDYTRWHRIREGTGRQSMTRLPGGWLTDFQAAEVLKPLRVQCCGEARLILDTGYRWINYAPDSTNHALMVQLNAANVPQQLYVDICDGHGVDPDGIVYVNDLYLDVIALCEVQPSGQWRVTATKIIDQDELDEALKGGKVTQAQYALAWAEAAAVQVALKQNAFYPVMVVQNYLTNFNHSPNRGPT